MYYLFHIALSIFFCIHSKKSIMQSHLTHEPLEHRDHRYWQRKRRSQIGHLLTPSKFRSFSIPSLTSVPHLKILLRCDVVEPFVPAIKNNCANK